MKQRFRRLGRYQKALLLAMAAMVLAFSAAYPAVIAREGFLYRGAILAPEPQDGGVAYSGKIKWQEACFTVAADDTVTFRYGSTSYGPYTAAADPSAVPAAGEAGNVLPDGLEGVELRCGEEVIFRGGVFDLGGSFLLYGEDGSPKIIGITVTTSDGVLLDETGSEVDPMEPSAADILALMAGPELTHKGDWLLWFCGALLCAANAVLILFADELFRWNLSFLVRNAEGAEPSDWEIASRYIGWTVLPLLALAIFVTGLQ